MNGCSRRHSRLLRPSYCGDSWPASSVVTAKSTWEGGQRLECRPMLLQADGEAGLEQSHIDRCSRNKKTGPKTTSSAKKAAYTQSWLCCSSAFSSTSSCPYFLTELRLFCSSKQLELRFLESNKDAKNRTFLSKTFSLGQDVWARKTVPESTRTRRVGRLFA